MGRQHRVELGAGDPVADDDLLGRPVSGECLGKIGHYLCPFSLLLGPVKKRGSKLFHPLILEYAMSVGFKLRDNTCDAEYLDQAAVWVCPSVRTMVRVSLPPGSS